MRVSKKNLLDLVKVLSLSSAVFLSGCGGGLTAREFLGLDGSYGDGQYVKPEGSIIFDYEKNVGPRPASRPSVTEPQPYRENLGGGRRHCE